MLSAATVGAFSVYTLVLGVLLCWRYFADYGPTSCVLHLKTEPVSREVVPRSGGAVVLPEKVPPGNNSILSAAADSPRHPFPPIPCRDDFPRAAQKFFYQTGRAAEIGVGGFFWSAAERVCRGLGR